MLIRLLNDWLLFSLSILLTHYLLQTTYSNYKDIIYIYLISQTPSLPDTEIFEKYIQHILTIYLAQHSPDLLNGQPQLFRSNVYSLTPKVLLQVEETLFQALEMPFSRQVYLVLVLFDVVDLFGLNGYSVTLESICSITYYMLEWRAEMEISTGLMTPLRLTTISFLFKFSWTKSVLFRTIMVFQAGNTFWSAKSLTFTNILSFSYSIFSSDPSITNKLMWLVFIFSKALLIPSFSTFCQVSRIPAVSDRLNWIPLYSKEVYDQQPTTFTMSRVVPGSSDTIATSSLAILFMIVLLPALGFPTITRLIPLLNASICLLLDSIDLISSTIDLALSFVLSNRSAFTSSQSYWKSMNASQAARQEIKSLLIFSKYSDVSPMIWHIAILLENQFSLWINPCSPSTSIKSILLLIKALLVNSPGSARRNPSLLSSEIASFRMAGLPCRWNQNMSSPLQLLPSGKYIIKHLSMGKF